MTSALTAAHPVRDPRQCLDGLTAIARRLIEDLDVRINYVAMDEADLGDWDSTTGTLRVRGDASIEQQVVLMTDLWFYLTIGPWAARFAIPEPLLRIVPTPRGHTDHSR